MPCYLQARRFAPISAVAGIADAHQGVRPEWTAPAKYVDKGSGALDLARHNTGMACLRDCRELKTKTLQGPARSSSAISVSTRVSGTGRRRRRPDDALSDLNSIPLGLSLRSGCIDGFGEHCGSVSSPGKLQSPRESSRQQERLCRRMRSSPTGGQNGRCICNQAGCARRSGNS